MRQRALQRCIVVLAILGIADSPPAMAHDEGPPPDGQTPGEPASPGGDPSPACPSPSSPGEECWTGVSRSGGSCETAHPVYLYDGTFYYERSDLLIRGRLPIDVRRYYDSRRVYKGHFGYGWSMNYHMRILKLHVPTGQAPKLLLKRGDNTKDEFTHSFGNMFVGPDGSFETITANMDGTYTLLRRSAVTYEFDENGVLTAINDRNGNQLLFAYDPAGLLPFSGVSHYSNLLTPITLGFDYRLIRIDEAHNGTPSGRFVEFTYDDNGHIVFMTDFTGREVIYTYDADNRGDLVRMADPESIEYVYAYDNQHRMIQFTGDFCATCGGGGDHSLYTNVYDDQDRAIEQRHGNSVVRIAYLDGPRTKVTTEIYDDEAGELLQTRFEYRDFGPGGETIKHTRQMGDELDEAAGSQEDDDIVVQYVYNADYQVTEKTDPRGAVTSYAYDFSGNLLTEAVADPGPEAHTWTTTYSYADFTVNLPTAKEISASFDPLTYRTEYSYDSVTGNLLEEGRYHDDGPPCVTAYTYNEHGDVETVTNPRGNVTAYEYDEYGFRTREYDPDNPAHQTLYHYDDLGNLTSITDARGNATIFEYDNIGRVTRTTNPLGEATIYTYTGPNLTQIEQGKTPTKSGQITRFEYDELNRRTAVKMLDDEGVEVTLTGYTYDSEGRILTITDGNGNTTTNTYDVLGRLVAVSDALGSTTSYSYDKNDNLVYTEDAENAKNPESLGTSYTYDFLNNQTSMQNALGHMTNFAYNALGDIVAITDARLKTWYYWRDRLGRLTEEENPLGHTTQYGYDCNNNLAGKITANESAGEGRPIVYTHDEYNRLWTIEYPGGSRTVTFGYDQADNRTSWDDGTLSGTTTHNELNRAQAVTTSYPGFSKSVSYTYDSVGNVRSVTDGEGNVTYYHYNALNRLRYITHPGSLISEYTYDAGGRLTGKTLPNGVSTSYAYDDPDPDRRCILGRLCDLVNSGPKGPISSYSYDYDRVGNRLSMTTLEGDHAYGYDDIYQLTSATHPEPDNPLESYSYDPVGNRLTSADYDDWDYDDANRLLGYGGTTFTYDESGNTTSKIDASGITTYEYNFDNRLVQASTPEHTAAYLYDPFGTRLAKTVDGLTTYFLYDREDIIAEYDGVGAAQKLYLHGQGIDEPIALVEGGSLYPVGDFDHSGTVGLNDHALFTGSLYGPGDPAGIYSDLDGDSDCDLLDWGVFQTRFGRSDAPDNIYYYLMDGLGSATALCDQRGAVAEEYSYDAFGTAVTQTANIESPYTYICREYDSEARLYHYRARFYDAGIGRFVQPDPVRDLNGRTLYAYVANNPVNWTDPLGESVFSCLGAVQDFHRNCTAKELERVREKANEIENRFFDFFDPNRSDVCQPKSGYVSIERLSAFNTPEFREFARTSGKCAWAISRMMIDCPRVLVVVLVP